MNVWIPSLISKAVSPSSLGWWFRRLLLLFLRLGGGCTLPLTAGALTGTDCSALPGVADVACRAGRCEVSQCMPDWKVSPDGTSCITLGGTSSLSAAYEFIQEQLTRVD